MAKKVAKQPRIKGGAKNKPVTKVTKTTKTEKKPVVSFTNQHTSSRAVRYKTVQRPVNAPYTNQYGSRK